MNEIMKQKIKDYLHKNTYGIDDRFVICDGKQHPCAIICPGGAYSVVCSFAEGVPIAKELNKHGISAIIVYYRVRQKAHYPHPQEDLARAIKEVFARQKEYHLDMSNYTIWGFSAGGHLVATFGTQAMGYSKYNIPKPKAIVLSYPVISLESSITHKLTRDYMIGKKATNEEELTYSAHTNVDENYPATFIWCGDADRVVSPINTKIMQEALDKNHIMNTCKVYPGVDHGVGVGTNTNAQGWIEEALTFIQSVNDKK